MAAAIATFAASQRSKKALHSAAIRTAWLPFLRQLKEAQFGHGRSQKEPKMKADARLEEAAKLYKERNAIYKDNFRTVGAAMAALFPEGVVLKDADDWNRMHIFILNMVKMSRYAMQWYEGGHDDSTQDMTVYPAILGQLDDEVAAKKM